LWEWQSCGNDNQKGNGKGNGKGHGKGSGGICGSPPFQKKRKRSE